VAVVAGVGVDVGVVVAVGVAEAVGVVVKVLAGFLAGLPSSSEVKRPIRDGHPTQLCIETLETLNQTGF